MGGGNPNTEVGERGPGAEKGEVMTKELDPGKIERDLERLEEIVGALEEGSLSLEESLKIYEEGIGLVRASRKALDLAGKKIEILSRGEVGAASEADEHAVDEAPVEEEGACGEGD